MAMISLVACGGDDNDTPNPPEKKSLKLTKVVSKTKSFTDKEKNEKEEVTKIIYGANGYVSKIKGVEGRFSDAVFTYNDKNQLTKKTNTTQDGNGKIQDVNIILYTHDEDGLLFVSEKEGEYKTTYEYNTENLMIKKVTARKNGRKSVFSYEYDANGNLIKLINKYFSPTYTFDDKKNPWATIFPKEYLAILPDWGGQHNVLSEIDKHYRIINTYTYNNEGYPVKKEEKYYIRKKLNKIKTKEFFYEYK